MDNLDKITEQFLRDLEEAEQKKYQERQEKEKRKAEKKRAEQEELNLRIKDNESVISGYENLLNQVKAKADDPGQLKLIRGAIQHIGELINLRYDSTLNTDRELISRLYNIQKDLAEVKLKIERTGNFSAINENEEELEDKEIYMDFNKPVITRNLTAFLVDELRAHRVFLSNINNTQMAKHFHELTGYSAKQLRGQLSNVRGKSTKYSEEDKNTLKAILLKISKEIDKL